MSTSISFGTTLRELRGAQKSAKGVSLYSRYVNRPLGRILAAAAYRIGLTPNQVTLISAVLSFAGIAAVAVLPPSWALGAGVYLALVLGFALDSADGQLARLKGGGSPAGEWLDHVIDCVKHASVHTAVLISFFRYFGLHPAWLLVPLAFQLAAVTTFFGGILTEKLKAKEPAGSAGPQPSVIRAVVLLPADYGIFCLVFLLLGAPPLFLVGYTLLAAATLLMTVAFLVKWFRELSAGQAHS